MKYQVIVDYYTEGWKFIDGEFATVDEAIKAATKHTYGNPFLVIQVVEWVAQPK